jgi:putative Mg2+ transporter-C (MgtC) family protein
MAMEPWDMWSPDFLGLDAQESLWFFAPKVLVGTVCGFGVGLERQLKDRPVGIRTAVLVCVGSALFTATAVLLSSELRAVSRAAGDAMPMFSDPGRIISQIVSGVGFIGAGVIFKLQDRVAGITTAALIWAVCAMGIIIGLGGYLTSIVLTAGLIGALMVIERIETMAAFRSIVARRKRAYLRRQAALGLQDDDASPTEKTSGAA